MTAKIFVTLLLVSLITACSEDKDPKVFFEKGKYEQAFPIWKSLAEKGDPEAQNYLGIHYLLGFGVNRDATLAKIWFEKAAIAGYPDAQRNLGVMYESGQAFERNFEQAYIWLYAAHRQGHPRAAATLQSLVPKLSPNNKLVLKKKAKKYILKDVLGPDADEF